MDVQLSRAVTPASTSLHEGQSWPTQTTAGPTHDRRGSGPHCSPLGYRLCRDLRHLPGVQVEHEVIRAVHHERHEVGAIERHHDVRDEVLADAAAAARDLPGHVQVPCAGAARRAGKKFRSDTIWATSRK